MMEFLARLKQMGLIRAVATARRHERWKHPAGRPPESDRDGAVDEGLEASANGTSLTER